MKKRVLSKIVMVGTAVLLLAAMMVSTLLGTTSAEYVKSLSQKLDIKATPDLAWKYYKADRYGVKSGIYQNSENIRESFMFRNENGGGVRYQIAIPVSETGKYSLKFKYDLLRNSSYTEFSDLYEGITYDSKGNEVKPAAMDKGFSGIFSYGVGCQVVSEGDVIDTSGPVTAEFGKNFVFRIGADNATHKNGSRIPYYSKNPDVVSKKLFNANDNCLWKTVSPTRAENVSLTFDVNADDVKEGYVIWVWDFNGVRGHDATVANTTIVLTLDNVSFDKILAPDNNAPYVDFPNMKYKNMTIIPNKAFGSTDATGNFYTNTHGDSKPTIPSSNVSGYDTLGITRPTVARGTFVTDATYDSMQMQAEPVYFGWDYSDESPLMGSDNVLNSDKSIKYNYTNPLAFYVPIRNVYANTKYRVTFDFSIAKQGPTSYREDKDSDGNSWESYGDYDPQLNAYGGGHGYFFGNANPTDLMMQSYLYKSAVQGYTRQIHNKTRVLYGMAQRGYDTHEVTRYDELTKYATGNNLAITTNTNSNNYYCNATSNINWLNAERHSDYNGENYIHWLTFKNTAFTFDIVGERAALDVNTPVTKYTGTDINQKLNLYWCFSFDSLNPTSWYRIKIENVRIEEVVSYASNIGDPEYVMAADTSGMSYSNVGVRLGSSTLTDANYNAAGLYRGSNSTGQSYQARGYSPTLVEVANNVYGAGYDVSGLVNSADKLKVYLSGYCVVDQGVDKYVWSADNGKTWHDMKYADGGPTDADAAMLTEAEKKINPRIKNRTEQTSNYKTFIDFQNTGGDSTYSGTVWVARNSQINADFLGYKIYADISEYSHLSGIDIIFAAVPRDKPNARCEIFRLENFNDAKNYISKITGISSDISVTDAATPVSTSISNDALAVGKGVSVVTDNEYYVYTGKKYSRYPAINDDVHYGVYYNNVEREVISLDNLITMFRDIPVKTTLTVSGWIASYGGVQGYYWSADGGKTWSECTQTAMASIEDGNSTVTGYVNNWLTTNTTSQANYLGTKGPNGRFNTAASQLKIDLSDYAGQVVDIIVAAQQTNRMCYAPVARIDNVAVYGDGSTDNPNDRGTFVSRVNEVYVNGGNMSTFTTAYESGSYFTYLDKWKTEIDSRYSTGGITYTPFEVCNTDIFHTRQASATPLAVANGGTIDLSGFVACPNGVNNYKYTLDGGITWTDINDTVADFYTGTGNNTDYVTNIKRVSSDLNEDSLKNGNFMNSGPNGEGEDSYYDPSVGWNSLKIILPSTLAQGEVRDLLVVAESNNASGEPSGKPSGKLYPVFHQTIRIAGGDELVHNDSITSSNASLTTTVANLQSDSYTLNYSAIPEIPMTKTAYYPSRYNESSLSVPKMYFFEDEDIPVTYSAQNVGDQAYIYITTTDNKYITWRYVANNSADTFNINECTGASQAGVDAQLRDLPAGDYKIWFIANNKTFYNSKTAEVWDYVVTEPISIKIIERDYSDNINWGVTHNYVSKTVNGDETVKGSISLAKTTFIQGEEIKVTATGDSSTSAGVMWYTIVPYGEWEYDHNADHWSYADAVDDPLKTSDLAPGQYMLYYVSGTDICNSADNSALDKGTIHTIIDITILPDEPSSTCTLTYTDSMGTTQTKEIKAIGFHNYDIKDMQLDVKTGTSVQIITEYKNFVGITDVKREFDFVPTT